MSITKDFEKKRFEIEHQPGYSSYYYKSEDVDKLVAHTRALETMLKKHEWSARDGVDLDSACPECRGWECLDHEPDCQLAKLLDGVE